jgi:hypothetical protein
MYVRRQPVLSCLPWALRRRRRLQLLLPLLLPLLSVLLMLALLVLPGPVASLHSEGIRASVHSAVTGHAARRGASQRGNMGERASQVGCSSA